MHFPRLILPIATAVVALVGFLICFWILLVLLDWYRVVPNWPTVLLPAFALLALLASIGAALSIAALNVNYRDFRYVIPFIVRFGLYVSPVGFTSNLPLNRWWLSYSLDQMVGEIDGFRYILRG